MVSQLPFARELCCHWPPRRKKREIRDDLNNSSEDEKRTRDTMGKCERTYERDEPRLEE